MIRKAIVVVLTLAAVVTSALNWRSYSNTIRGEVRLTSKDVLFFHFTNGFSRVATRFEREYGETTAHEFGRPKLERKGKR